jgi:meso-butanediol dehydrogenase / (S,S)-butanediol dehydrogenase / diacetyl reductase
MSGPNGQATRVTLITGGARGIGRGIALRLASDGLDIAIADLPSMHSEAEAVADEVRGEGRRATVIDADVSDPAQVDSMVAETVRELGSVDVMIANAGIADVAQLLDVTPDAFDRLMSTTCAASSSATRPPRAR